MTETDITPIVAAECAQRRTFAIISHPDAGKTTLTEKLLLYAGMIRTAGMVGSRKSGKKAASDWMGMEQERGISITASAMQFRYKDVVINVLDTPGHQDFSEDTYRTLTAADSAVMVIDAAKGVETQTRKLFAVCRMRNTPILTFINKMDLPGRDPLDLLSELEEILGIHAVPMNWPIGSGKDFVGVVDRKSRDIILFEKSSAGGAKQAISKRLTLAEALASGAISAEQIKQAESDLELLEGAGNPFSADEFLAGKITPVFFGSALTNFGVEIFFDSFASLAPCPAPRPVNCTNGEERLVDPVKEPFSAYVFKIQANMDPRHRDSMAFLRVCSGRFERDLIVKHPRVEKPLRLSRSHSMFGAERSTVDYAYPGDIIGVVNPGVFKMGDTVSVEGGFSYKPLPRFSPEIVAQIRPIDVNRKKAFTKGLQQLTDEGAVLLLESWRPSTGTPLVAAVGQLQFEVLQYRLEHEYQVKTRLDTMPFRAGAWLVGDPNTFELPSGSMLAVDSEGKYIFLYGVEWEKRYALEKNPKHELRSLLV